MILINFTHPLSKMQLERVEEIAGLPITSIIETMLRLDHARSFADQVAELIESIRLTKSEWQTEAILVNLPALAISAACVIAELHGKMGYFPIVTRVRPVFGSTPPTYEVAEIINLQAIRDAGRSRLR